jgi:hypothetical protein
MCACGHVRKHHRGLRLEIAGPCLECGCEEFRRARTSPDPHEQMVKTLRAGLDQVELLHGIVARLRGQLAQDGFNGRRDRKY